MRVALLALLLLQMATPQPTVTTNEAAFLKRTYAAGKLSMPYRLFVPRGYDAKKRYPLIVYLHGGAGVGTDNEKQIRGGNGMGIDLFVRNQQTVPAFILAPQSSGSGWLMARGVGSLQLLAVPELIGAVARQYSIDSRRVYVGGQSLGGYGTYALVAARPEMFAAAFVLCGGGDPARAPRLARVPFWLFHGSADRIVNVSEAYTMRDAIRRAGGIARYTEYRGEGHQIWQHVTKEKDLPPWLFSQTRR